MAPRIIDEREHRRGLILGLTLAESLLLLLFLLLLALTFELKKRIDATREAQSEVTLLRHQVDEFKPVVKDLIEGHTENLRSLADRLERLREMEALLASTAIKDSDLKRLINLVKPFMNDSSQVVALDLFLEQAARIDPDDPPAALRRALAFIKVAGKEIRPDQIAVLTHAVRTQKSLAEFEALYNEAARIDPTDPPSVLKKGMETLVQYLAQNKSSKREEGHASGEHNWPPIISLSEAGGYFFATGKAELSLEFERKLRGEIVPLLIQRAAKYRVDIIEVTGHTDEQAITPRNSNLDQALLPVLRGDGQISTLVPSDNAGLGLARAVAVVRTLIGDPRMHAYKILPMSGGQLIDVGERVTEGNKGDVKERRRIEIRLRRSQEASEKRAMVSPRSQ